jgi:hypothetical protein
MSADDAFIILNDLIVFPSFFFASSVRALLWRLFYNNIDIWIVPN